MLLSKGSVRVPAQRIRDDEGVPWAVDIWSKQLSGEGLEEKRSPSYSDGGLHAVASDVCARGTRAPGVS